MPGRRTRLRLLLALLLHGRAAAEPAAAAPVGRRHAGEAARLLEDPALAFLGTWRSNVKYLLEVNARLVAGGPPVVIPGFLSAKVAEELGVELQRLVARGRFRLQGPDLNTTTGRGDAHAVAAAGPAAARCAALSPGAHELPRSRFHKLAIGDADADLEGSPRVKEVLQGLHSRSWAEALNLLLTGTGLRTQEKRPQELVAPSIREFAPGDYMEVHSDLEASDRRVLALVFWLDKWVPEHGGGFLWCGGASEDGQEYPEAVSVPHVGNALALFAPHADTLHAVEPVQVGAPFRFSVSSWLLTEALWVDVPEHQEALRLRQQEARAAAAAAAEL